MASLFELQIRRELGHDLIEAARRPWHACDVTDDWATERHSAKPVEPAASAAAPTSRSRRRRSTAQR